MRERACPLNSDSYLYLIQDAQDISHSSELWLGRDFIFCPTPVFVSILGNGLLALVRSVWIVELITQRPSDSEDKGFLNVCSKAVLTDGPKSLTNKGKPKESKVHQLCRPAAQELMNSVSSHVSNAGWLREGGCSILLVLLAVALEDGDQHQCLWKVSRAFRCLQGKSHVSWVPG